MQEDKLTELLSEWRIDSAPPRDFNATVWRRIEKAQSISIRNALALWMNHLFARPAVALSYVAIAVVIGASAGQIHGSRDLRAAEAQLKTRYIQSVDPYAKMLIP